MQSMEYKNFFRNFGGSVRTKHIAYARTGRTNFLRSVYGTVKSTVLMREASKRRFKLPAVSGLPRDFMRMDPWEVEYLYVIAQRAKKGIVEIGRWNGGSTFLMSCANGKTPIWSVDIAPQDDNLLKDYLKKYNIGANVNLIVGDSQKTKYPQVGAYDMLFIDGDHSYEGCKADIENWYPGLAIGGHLVFHDCYLGCEGVQRAVSEFLEAHPEAQVIQSPYVGAHHWNYPAGSVAHFIKRA